MEDSTQKTATTWDWDDRLRAFKASGQNASQWCREHGIPVHQLRYRLRKEKEAHPTPVSNGHSHWVALPSAPDSNAVSSGVSLRIGSVDVNVERGFDPDVLSDVLRSLLEEC